MNDDLNLPLRTEILDIALKVEHNIDWVLLVCLSIENEERKAITNKSGSITFKNKIDLLFDLEVLSKEEHKNFLLLMEFRNQFLHNIDCNSFTYAVNVLGKDKEKGLLAFDDVEFNCDLEFRYNNAYKNLFSKTLEIALDKVNERKQIIEDKAKILKIQTEEKVYVMDSYFGIIDKVLELCEPNHSDLPEIFELKSKIYKNIGIDFDKVFSTDEYKHLKTQLNNLHTPEKIRKYFK